MRKLHNPKLTANAKTLRKNMTDQERKLWYTYIKKLPWHFSRQKVLNNYIVDFYCASAKMIIEIDGSQHYEDEGLQADKKRDEFFTANGFKVLRYTNLEIDTRFDNVCQDIYLHLTSDK